MKLQQLSVKSSETCEMNAVAHCQYLPVLYIERYQSTVESLFRGDSRQARVGTIIILHYTSELKIRTHTLSSCSRHIEFDRRERVGRYDRHESTARDGNSYAPWFPQGFFSEIEIGIVKEVSIIIVPAF